MSKSIKLNDDDVLLNAMPYVNDTSTTALQKLPTLNDRVATYSNATFATRNSDDNRFITIMRYSSNLSVAVAVTMSGAKMETSLYNGSSWSAWKSITFS